MSEEKKHKRGRHTHTTIEHHHDSSHTSHKHFEDGSKESSAHANLDGVHDMMEDAHGSPNPGEAEADAGQHGVPEAQAAPAGLPSQPAAGAMPGAGA